MFVLQLAGEGCTSFSPIPFTSAPSQYSCMSGTRPAHVPSSLWVRCPPTKPVAAGTWGPMAFIPVPLQLPVCHTVRRPVGRREGVLGCSHRNLAQPLLHRATHDPQLASPGSGDEPSAL